MPKLRMFNIIFYYLILCITLHFPVFSPFSATYSYHMDPNPKNVHWKKLLTEKSVIVGFVHLGTFCGSFIENHSALQTATNLVNRLFCFRYRTCSSSVNFIFRNSGVSLSWQTHVCEFTRMRNWLAVVVVSTTSYVAFNVVRNESDFNSVYIDAC